ncbi:MAG: thioredoxin-disulfide reductase [Candidatus Dadabacteria bacterium]|nr:MAG: thioredoxin-disulfide reductase [Candidatus Dadabacteria bacterium]
MAETKHSKVLILGSGPAGLTAAIYTARANLSPLLVHGPTPGGQLTTTTEVENFPGFPEGVMGPDLMQLFEKQAVRFGTEILTDTIVSVDLSKRPFELTGQGDRRYSCDALIVATGANPRLLGVEGESELMGYGVSTCATCDGAFFRDKVIMVIGGGDSACEEALFLTRFGSKVILVHRRDSLRASKIMQDRVLNHEKIEILWNKQLKKIHGSKESGVTAVTLFHSETKEEEQVNTDAVFIAIGHIPNSQLFKGQLELDENGYIVPAPNSTRTNVEGVFACGDVQDHVFRQAVTAAGSGCMAAIEAERWLEDSSG